MDAKTQAKQEILKEIIALMDKSMSEGLASKSPKMAAMEAEAEEMPAPMADAEMSEEAEPSDDEMSEDDIEKLKALHAQLK